MRVAIIGACALVAGASADVVNGGFELPDAGFRTVNSGQTYGGWTAGGPSDIEFVHATVDPRLPGLESSAYEGEYWIDLTGVGAPSSIYQDVATVAGQQYEISFAMAGNPWSGPQIMGMNVVWNSGIAGQFTHDTTGRSGADMGWTVYTVIVTGTGNDRLMFRGTSGSQAAGAALDGVIMRPIPAPGVLAGLMGGLVMARRKR